MRVPFHPPPARLPAAAPGERDVPARTSRQPLHFIRIKNIPAFGTRDVPAGNGDTGAALCVSGKQQYRCLGFFGRELEPPRRGKTERGRPAIHFARDKCESTAAQCFFHDPQAIAVAGRCRQKKPGRIEPEGRNPWPMELGPCRTAAAMPRTTGQAEKNPSSHKPPAQREILSPPPYRDRRKPQSHATHLSLSPPSGRASSIPVPSEIAPGKPAFPGSPPAIRSFRSAMSARLSTVFRSFCS